MATQVVLLAACEQAATARRDGATVRPLPAAVLRDTITIAVGREPDTLFLPASSVPSVAVIGAALSQGPTERDDQGVWQPRLAERTPTLENGGARIEGGVLSVTWKIRPGARFANGDAVTADDLRASWELALRRDVPVIARTRATYYARIDTPDPSTAVVVYRAGQLDPLYQSFCCTVVPRTTVVALDPTASPVYAGPYRLTERVPGVSLTLEAIPAFWLGAPKARKLVFRFGLSPADLLAGLRTGALDVVTTDAITPDLLTELERTAAASGQQVRVTPAQTWEHVDVNLRDPRDLTRAHPILGDRAVREALARGLDRPAIATEALAGKGPVISSFLFGTSWAKAADSEITVYGFDQPAARRLLDDAGWKTAADGIRERSGRRLSLTLALTGGDVTRDRTARSLVSQLKAIGVEVLPEVVTAPRLFAARGEGLLSAGTFDLGLYAWVLGDDPQTFFYSCDQIPSRENAFAGQNYTGWCDRQFDEAVAAGNTRLAQAERKPAYVRAQQLWTTALPVLPLYQRVNIDVAHSGLRGFRQSQTATPVTFNVWEWELTR